MQRRTPRGRPDPVRAQIATQRLAQLAAGLGATNPGKPTDPTQPGDPGDLREPGEPAWWADHTRVAGSGTSVGTNARSWSHERALEGARTLAPDEADTLPAAPALPIPGRHAARRSRPPVLGGWRETVRDRMPVLAPVHIAVVAIIVALGLAVTTWWVLRDQPEQIRPVAAEPVEPLVDSATPSAQASDGATAPAGAGEGTVTVDVAGKVRRPGIVVLEQGSRVTDALEQAGGARNGVDLTSINLARVLVDGEQIVVGGPPSAGAPAPAGAAQSGAEGPLVNLNLASTTELEALPQVGPVTAEAIVAWRDEHGGFTRIDELLEVDGIGDKTLERLKPHVTV